MATSGSKSGQICFPVPKGVSPQVKKVIDLKLGKGLTEEELKKILSDASKHSVGYVVLNAPFKLRSTPPAA